MTTKPKAKKFRIRRSMSPAPRGPAENAAPTGMAEPAPQQPQPPAQPQIPAPQENVAPQDAEMAPQAQTGQVDTARQVQGETELDAIRREGLTGRQLRMARRVAQQHKLPATSDFDAVRLLRERGIDPFQRSNMLELVVPQNTANAGNEEPQTRVQLPQTVPVQKQNLPSTELSPSEQRQRDISEIQRDIMRRRRHKLMMLGARLAFFVLLPTFVAGWYFYRIATPMYATKSEFLILQADNAGGAGIGGLLSGTQFATSQDSIAVQSFLESKEVMLRLDADEGFKDHFTQEWLDPIQRLEPGASNEDAYKIYKKNVKLGYDPTEGVIRMEVSAADPEFATRISDQLITYAEERVNGLSQKKRGDQMKDALSGFEEAEEQRRLAQQRLVELQQEGELLDPLAAIAALRSQITNVEVLLQEKELELAALQDNLRPNKAKVQGVEGDIRRLKALLADLNDRMTDASRGKNSLAQLAVRIQMAEADLATRDLMLQSALQQVEQTRMEANRQVRYLTTSVVPVPSETPSYPRKFENTILAFLIFSGAYLMISLTASILREQVTS
ncbi:MAG: capsule biosynthesis protein [Paracoccaceae bacterium]